MLIQALGIPLGGWVTDAFHTSVQSVFPVRAENLVLACSHPLGLHVKDAFWSTFWTLDVKPKMLIIFLRDPLEIVLQIWALPQLQFVLAGSFESNRLWYVYDCWESSQRLTDMREPSPLLAISSLSRWPWLYKKASKATQRGQ